MAFVNELLPTAGVPFNMQAVEELWVLAGQNWMLLPPDFIINQVYYVICCQCEFSCQALLFKQLTMAQMWVQHLVWP